MKLMLRDWALASRAWNQRGCVVESLREQGPVGVRADGSEEIAASQGLEDRIPEVLGGALDEGARDHASARHDVDTGEVPAAGPGAQHLGRLQGVVDGEEDVGFARAVAPAEEDRPGCGQRPMATVGQDAQGVGDVGGRVGQVEEALGIRRQRRTGHLAGQTAGGGLANEGEVHHVEERDIVEHLGADGQDIAVRR